MSEVLVRSLIRLLVTVGIIAAVYLFIVRPILDETSEQFDRAFDTSDAITKQIQNSLDDAGLGDVDPSDFSAAESQQLVKCIQRVQPDTARMQRCAKRFSP